MLIVSHPINPLLVERSVVKASEAKQLLGDPLGSVILAPISHGSFADRSFALWPLHRDLSRSRVVRYVQKAHVRRSAFRWLQDATRHTMRSDAVIGSQRSLESIYTVPLTTMAENSRLSVGLRNASAQALEELRAGSLVHDDGKVQAACRSQSARSLKAQAREMDAALSSSHPQRTRRRFTGTAKPISSIRNAARPAAPTCS